MSNRLTQSSMVLTLSIAVSSFGYILMGFDAVGDPMFEQHIYLMLLLSPALPLCAMTWFIAGGNSVDSCARNIIHGHVLGLLATLGWVAFSVGDLSTLQVLPVFLLPMAMMGFVHLFVLCFSLALGAGLAHILRWLARARKFG